jgi:hypothetical protein
MTMINSHEADFGQRMLAAIQTHMVDQYDRILERKKAELIQELEQEKARTIAAAAIYISEHMTLEDNGRHLTITIVKERQ